MDIGDVKELSNMQEKKDRNDCLKPCTGCLFVHPTRNETSLRVWSCNDVLVHATSFFLIAASSCVFSQYKQCTAKGESLSRSLYIPLFLFVIYIRGLSFHRTRRRLITSTRSSEERLALHARLLSTILGAFYISFATHTNIEHAIDY